MATRFFALLLTIVSLGLFFAFLLIQQAFAADTTISLSEILDPIKPLLVELVTILVGGFVGWVAVKFNKLTSLNIEAKHREVLHSALMNGALAGVSYASKLSADKKIDVRSEIVREGLVYASRAAPEAIRYFGLTPERLQEMLEAKLPATRL